MSAAGCFKFLGDKFTYLKIFYLFLSFPLGIIYFVFLVTGISLGFGLLIILVGIPILLGVLIVSRFLVQREKGLATALLGIELPSDFVSQPADSIWERIRLLVVNFSTWKGLVYLFIKFPLGIVSFIIATTSLALSLGLLTAPLTYPYNVINLGTWKIDSLPAAIAGTVIGLLMTYLSLKILPLLADGHGLLAKVLLTETLKHAEEAS